MLACIAVRAAHERAVRPSSPALAAGGGHALAPAWAGLGLHGALFFWRRRQDRPLVQAIEAAHQWALWIWTCATCSHWTPPGLTDWNKSSRLWPSAAAAWQYTSQEQVRSLMGARASAPSWRRPRQQRIRTGALAGSA